MIAWFNGLSSEQQMWTWFLLALCSVGIFRLIWMCLRSWIFDIAFINKYLEAARNFARKFRNNGNNAEECAHLIGMREKATNILGRDRVAYPEVKLASCIKYKTIYNPADADDLVDLLHADCLEWDQRRRSRGGLYLLQLFIPVLFWLFCGIESSLLIIAYLLKELGWKPKKDVKSNLISVISTIFTIITGLASFFSYLDMKFW